MGESGGGAFLVNLSRNNVEDTRFQHESLALGYLSRVLEDDGARADVVDCQVVRVSDAEIVERALAARPRLVGVCASVQEMFPRIREFLELLRRRGCDAHVILGGLFATTAARLILETLPEVDSVCIGEGEPVVVELMRRLRDGRPLDGLAGLTWRKDGAVTGEGSIAFVEQMDTLPFPTRKTVHTLKALGRRSCMMASRGCIARCNFCSAETIMDMGSPRRHRSPRHVVDEMMDLHERWGVTRFRFNDPIFIGPGSAGAQWGFDFCEELRRRGKHGAFDMVVHLRSVEAINEPLMRALADAGVTKVVLGVESASGRILRWMKKPSMVGLNDQAMNTLRRCGISIDMAFIFFVPPLTLDDVVTNLRFIERHDALSPFTLTSSLEVYIGCAVERLLLDEGNLERANWWELGTWRFEDPQMRRFWELVQPVLAAFQGAGDELHRLDVAVQRSKAEKLDTGSKRALGELSKRVARTLADAYLALIEDIRADRSPDGTVARAIAELRAAERETEAARTAAQHTAAARAGASEAEPLAAGAE